MGGKGGGGGNAVWVPPGTVAAKEGEAGALTSSPAEPTAATAPVTETAAPVTEAPASTPEVTAATPEAAASTTASLGTPVSPGGPVTQPTKAANNSTGDALAGAINEAPYWVGDINEYGRRVTRPGADSNSLKVTQT